MKLVPFKKELALARGSDVCKEYKVPKLTKKLRKELVEWLESYKPLPKKTVRLR